MAASADEIRQATQFRWMSFDRFKELAFAVWVVRMTENWKSASCTCPYFLKKQKCKHILGLAMQLKLVKPPPAAKDTPIGQKRKRGRPKKAYNALLID